MERGSRPEACAAAGRHHGNISAAAQGAQFGLGACRRDAGLTGRDSTASASHDGRDVDGFQPL